MPITKLEQMIECAEQMEQGMIQTQTYRDMWQNNLVWWMCKAIKLLLEDRIKEKSVNNNAVKLLLEKRAYENLQNYISVPNGIERCLELIVGIAFDYDGATTVEELKSLIDEIAGIAKDGLIFLNESKIHKNFIHINEDYRKE